MLDIIFLIQDAFELSILNELWLWVEPKKSGHNETSLFKLHEVAIKH